MTGHIDCAELVLARQGWSPSGWQNTDETPLHLAVRFRHDEFAKRLAAVEGASQWEEVDNENLTPLDYQTLFDVSQLPRAPRSPPDQRGSQETDAERETPPDWQCQTSENNHGKLENVRLRQPSQEVRDEWSRLEQHASEAGILGYAMDELVEVIQYAEEKVSLLETNI